MGGPNHPFTFFWKYLCKYYCSIHLNADIEHIDSKKIFFFSTTGLQWPYYLYLAFLYSHTLSCTHSGTQWIHLQMHQRHSTVEQLTNKHHAYIHQVFEQLTLTTKSMHTFTITITYSHSSQSISFSSDDSDIHLFSHNQSTQMSSKPLMSAPPCNHWAQHSQSTTCGFSRWTGTTFYIWPQTILWELFCKHKNPNPGRHKSGSDITFLPGPINPWLDCVFL